MIYWASEDVKLYPLPFSDTMAKKSSTLRWSNINAAFAEPHFHSKRELRTAKRKHAHTRREIMTLIGTDETDRRRHVTSDYSSIRRKREGVGTHSATCARLAHVRDLRGPRLTSDRDGGLASGRNRLRRGHKAAKREPKDGGQKYEMGEIG